MRVNVFDQAARYSIQSDPLGFLRWVVPGLDPALEFHGWLDTRTVPFPGAPDRTCDTVAELAAADAGDGGPRWALAIEFQAAPDPAEMLDRQLEYLIRIRRDLRFGPQRSEKFGVAAVLVSMTGAHQPDTLDMVLPVQGLAPPALHFHAGSKTLRDEDAFATLEEIVAGRTSRCVLCWISLMRGGIEAGIIERWKEVAGSEPDVSLRAIYGAIVLIFAELSESTVIWRSGLEGWNMRESAIVNEWIAEGEAKAKRGDLLRLLQLKFRTPVPPDLVAQVEAETSLDVLSQWFESAILAETLDAFLGTIPGSIVRS